MLSLLDRYKWVLLLAVLVSLNVIRYWPARHPPGDAPGSPPGIGPNGFPPPDATMQARLDALPEEQRTAIQARMQQDKDFLASVQNLPETERRDKIREHFARNPPPPGMFPGGPGGPPPPASGTGNPPGVPGGPDGGGPGGGDAPHIPPPDVRRDMDQGIVNAMKNPQPEEQPQQ